MKEAMFPVEWCFQPDVTKACWIHWLSIDRAYFYSSIFVLSAMDDVVRDMRQRDLAVPRYGAGPLFSTTTSRYLRLTIQHLQEKLDDPRQQTDDVTIGVVIALGMVADAVGDTEAARAHISGLRQMAKLRGGPDAFGKNNPVLVKLYRYAVNKNIKMVQHTIYPADTDGSDST